MGCTTVLSLSTFHGPMSHTPKSCQKRICAAAIQKQRQFAGDFAFPCWKHTAVQWPIQWAPLRSITRLKRDSVFCYHNTAGRAQGQRATKLRSTSDMLSLIALFCQLHSSDPCIKKMSCVWFPSCKSCCCTPRHDYFHLAHFKPPCAAPLPEDRLLRGTPLRSFLLVGQALRCAAHAATALVDPPRVSAVCPSPPDPLPPPLL